MTSPRSPHSSSNARREDGNLLVLGLGMWVVIVALIMALGSVISVHNARKDLFAQADSVAIALASHISDAAYYTQSASMPSYQSTDVVRLASAELGALSDGTGSPPTLSSPTGVSAGVVTVTLNQSVDLPLLPSFLPGPKAVQVTVTSHARLRDLSVDIP